MSDKPLRTPNYLRFFAAGEPVTQGSMRNVAPLGQRARLTSDSPHLKAWRESIGFYAMACRAEKWEGALAVELLFRVQRPKSHFTKEFGLLKTSAPQHPTKKPDVDKLARACLDALTSIAWNDDAQVVELKATKVYAYGDVAPMGVLVQVRKLEG